MKLRTPEGVPTRLQAGDDIDVDLRDGFISIERNGRKLSWGSEQADASPGMPICGMVPVNPMAALSLIRCMAIASGLDIESTAQPGDGHFIVKVR